ncbi:hypothetical protein [Bacillus sp. FJAT-27264]|nr:hypothetical protein [Bacillus sp. FJAT-27264]
MTGISVENEKSDDTQVPADLLLNLTDLRQLKGMDIECSPKAFYGFDII